MMTASGEPASARAVLWDLDGTLVDTADHHLASWRAALADLGVDLTPRMFVRTFGRRNVDVLRDLLGDGLSDAEVRRLGATKEEDYRARVRAGSLMTLPGVREWLMRLHADGWKQAIASSAPHANIEAILDALSLHRVFDAIASDEDVQHGKPDPQVFLMAAAKLGVPPERCVVVEDAPAGIEAARRAGIRSIGVRSGHERLAADVVVNSLTELPDDVFERLLDMPAPTPEGH